MNFKSLCYPSDYCRRTLNKTLLVMKLTTIFLIAACLQVSASGYAQVTISEKNVTLQKVFKQIHRQTGFEFLYSVELLQQSGKVSVDVRDVTVQDALRACLTGKPLSYSIVNNTIVIEPKKQTVGNVVTDEIPPIEVKGIIVNEKGAPVEGVSIVVKGTKKGTTTNSKGEFTLSNVDKDAILVLTSINIETKEIKVSNRADLGSISITTKIIESAVVVMNTGYQTISRERVTAAHDRVGDEILSKRPYANIADALAGQIAGLVVDPVTGFTIRGRSSLSGAADRTPLLVVDGFPIEGGFNTINPNDVKSIDVLKDAAATSIYGARAANGVIVIVTKNTGPKGKLNVNFNSFVSIGSKIDLDNYMNMADAATQMAFEDNLHSVLKISAANNPYSNTNGHFRGIRSPYATLLIEKDKGNITQEYFDSKRQEMLNSNYKDDYNKYLLRNSISHQQNLMISGTGDRNSYKFSALLDNDRTSMQFNDNNKVLLGFTNIFNITNNIKYTFNSNYTIYSSKNNGISLSHAKSVTTPWTKLVDDEGNYTRMNYQNYEPIVKTYEPRMPYSMRYNLLEEASLRNNVYRGQDIRLQNEFEFKITNGLRFRPMFQYELFNDQSTSLYDENSYAVRNYADWLSVLNTTSGKYVSQIPAGGIYRNNGENRRQSIKLRAQLDYNRRFGSKHELIALAGAEVISTKTEVTGPDLKFGYNKGGLNYAAFDYATDRFDMFNLGTVLENSVAYEGNLIYNYRDPNFRQDYKYNERFLAGYFNGSYTYNNKYTASFSMRTDASNYVSKTVREKFSPFYSAGVRWNVKSEKFMKNVDFVDRLALRGTYGVTGNAAGKRSVLALSVYTSLAPTTETGNLSNGIITGRDNDFLTWEKTYSTNIGADFSLFKGKLTGSIDVYRRHSKDLLSSVKTSQVVQSTSSLTLNLAEVLNKGIEISLGTNMNITKGLSWNGNVNFDYNYNEVLSYNFVSPALFYYLGSNGSFIKGLPTDRLMMVRLAGTTKDGYYVQQKKDGELIIANNSSNTFGEVSGFGMGRMVPGLNPRDDDRMYYQGRTTPPATLGFTNTFNYKGLSLMAVITGKFGHKFLRTDEYLSYSLINNNYSASGLASMQNPSLVATTSTGNINPTLLNQAMWFNSASLRDFYSEEIVSDASHIRLNEIYLGYDLSDKTLNKMKKFFKSVTVYTQARNLGLLWRANDYGVDPEYPLGTLKPVKTYTFGVRLGM